MVSEGHTPLSDERLAEIRAEIVGVHGEKWIDIRGKDGMTPARFAYCRNGCGEQWRLDEPHNHSLACGYGMAEELLTEIDRLRVGLTVEQQWHEEASANAKDAEGRCDSAGSDLAEILGLSLRDVDHTNLDDMVERVGVALAAEREQRVAEQQRREEAEAGAAVLRSQAAAAVASEHIPVLHAVQIHHLQHVLEATDAGRALAKRVRAMEAAMEAVRFVVPAEGSRCIACGLLQHTSWCPISLIVERLAALDAQTLISDRPLTQREMDHALTIDPALDVAGMEGEEGRG